jgi:hypothetical protein
MSLWWIDVLCVRGMGSPWTIFFFIVTWLITFGLLAAVWKIVFTWLLWCLWKERNDRSLEYYERTLEEIKSFFFRTLYLWTDAYVSPLSISYSDFLIIFVPSSYVLPLVYFRYT